MMDGIPMAAARGRDVDRTSGGGERTCLAPSDLPRPRPRYRIGVTGRPRVGRVPAVTRDVSRMVPRVAAVVRKGLLPPSLLPRGHDVTVIV